MVCLFCAFNITGDMKYEVFKIVLLLSCLLGHPVPGVQLKPWSVCSSPPDPEKTVEEEKEEEEGRS